MVERINCSLAQAEGMARFSGVSITPEQKHLYVILREITKDMEGISNSSLEIIHPWILTDQRLLAEVIRLTDKTKLDVFMRAYPNIFK